MVRWYYILFIICLSTSIFAQEHRPRRTAFDIARKQTEMLVRELDIVDSVMRDTLYRMHLKYAKKQFQFASQSEALECMQNMLTELKNILPIELFERFMNRHVNGAPRSPYHSCNWVNLSPQHGLELPHQRHEAPHMPPPPLGNQPPNHQ